MANDNSETYVDSKGRIRWYCNDNIATKLKRLHDYLVIGNYDESHAARYPRLAHAISRYPESIKQLQKEGRLSELPGVSDKISVIISELVLTGTCSKMEDGDEFFQPPPKSVLELTEVPRLGAKTAKMLFQEHGISSFKELLDSAENGSLTQIKGIGCSMVTLIRKHSEEIRNK